MVGGASEHSSIQRDLKIEVAGSVRYPDGFVVCTPLPRGTLVVHEPVIVFEVLSPSTQRSDRIVKLRGYQATPSIWHYVMLEQGRIAATVVSRRGEDWLIRVLLDGDVLAMPEIGVEIPVDEPTAAGG